MLCSPFIYFHQQHPLLYLFPSNIQIFYNLTLFFFNTFSLIYNLFLILLIFLLRHQLIGLYLHSCKLLYIPIHIYLNLTILSVNYLRRTKPSIYVLMLVQHLIILIILTSMLVLSYSHSLAVQLCSISAFINSSCVIKSFL